ncbi:LPP20 family lipoprotein [bacterium]|nr:LPP20 family lipoprotein [bacterium]
MTRMVLSIAGAVLILGCSSGKAGMAQTTVKNGDEITRKYPADRYIVRSGLGESQDAATEAARLEIAKFFESKISGESVINEWAQNRSEGGKTVEKRLTELSNTIKVSAAREIPGIEIAGMKKDNKNNVVEIWAVLDKSTYVTVLNDRIKKLDADADQRLANTQGDDLTRLRDLANAAKDLVDREKERQDLGLLIPGGAGESRNPVLRNVLTSIDSLIAEAFDVGLISDGEVDSEIVTGLIKGIVDTGIRIREYPDLSSATSAGTDLVMSVKNDVTKGTRKTKVGSKEYDFANITWVLSVSALEPKTSKVINTIVLREQISELGDETRAQQRMVQKVLQTQVPSVSSWVYKLIFAPAEK